MWRRYGGVEKGVEGGWVGVRAGVWGVEKMGGVEKGGGEEKGGGVEDRDVGCGEDVGVLRRRWDEERRWGCGEGGWCM